MNDRLSKSDWIDQGLRTLMRDGANGLKVGPMAEGLNVSRGSFYWHFRDIADFRAQLLEAWQALTTDHVIQELDAMTGKPDRLAHLLQRGFGGNRMDRAVRSWATEDADVAKMVATNDVRRVAYMADLLVAEGVNGGQAEDRATFLYWAYLGRSFVMDARHASLSHPAMDDIGRLFST